MKVLVSILLALSVLTGCKQDEPKTTEYKITGRTYTRFKDMGILGGTPYYEGCKFISSDSVIKFQYFENYPLPFATTVVYPKYQLSYKSKYPYKLNYPNFTIQLGGLAGNFGEIINSDVIKLSNNTMMTETTDTELIKFLTDSIK